MPPTPNIPPILRLAERFACECEKAVRSFDRYYKYTLGTDIRQQAMMIWRLANRAWLDRNNQIQYLQQLGFTIDDMKLSLLLAKRLQIFASIAQFEMLSLLVVDLGRQCGGWLRAINRH